MKVSQKYKEIFRLKQMLEDSCIPFDFYELDAEVKKVMPDWEHYHINYPSKSNCIISVIEGTGTYGEQEDKLEIMGGLTEEEATHDKVVGWLTAEEVFKRIKKDYLGGIKMKKIIKIIDEDTLEIKEVEIATEGEEDDKINTLFDNAITCDPKEFIEKFNKFKVAEKEFNEIYEPFKESLLKLYENNSDQPLPKVCIFGDVKLTYVSPSVRTSIDTKKLQEEEPAIANKYSKTTNVKATMRLTDLTNIKR